MLSRRGFLAAAAAALVLDPERALWVPGRRSISIPVNPAPGLAAQAAAFYQECYERALANWVDVAMRPYPMTMERRQLINEASKVRILAAANLIDGRMIPAACFRADRWPF